jgi:hypothetical protein
MSRAGARDPAHQIGTRVTVHVMTHAPPGWTGDWPDPRSGTGSQHSRVPTWRGRDLALSGQADHSRFAGPFFGFCAGALAGGVVAARCGVHDSAFGAALLVSAAAGAFLGARLLTPALRALGRLVRTWVKPSPDFPPQRRQSIGGLVGSAIGIAVGAWGAGFYSAVFGMMFGWAAGQGVVIWTWKAGRPSARLVLPLLIVALMTAWTRYSAWTLYSPNPPHRPADMFYRGMAWAIVGVTGLGLVVQAYRLCTRRRGQDSPGP